jgi:aspartyl-tRNA synthetase
MVTVSDLFKQTEYKIFKMIVEKGGLIKGITLKNMADKMSKNFLQEEVAKGLIPKLGAKGMTWMKVIDGQLESNIVQFFSPEEQQKLIAHMNAENGDVLVFIADTDHALVNRVLGQFRVIIAQQMGIIPPNQFAICWVTDFPLFERVEGNVSPMHHPFTQSQAPIESTDADHLLSLKARAYDLVINGEEVGGGSIRIHDPQQQVSVFKALGMTDAQIEENFGFFVKALSYGAPPHGGLALGVDRLIAMILGEDSIREVIAFPKNRMAVCPLTQSPSEVKPEQWDELHLLPKPQLD